MWRISLLLVFTFLSTRLAAQFQSGADFYRKADYTDQLDSLRKIYGGKVSYKNSQHTELATLLAISHYPLLQNRKVKVIIKKVKGAPVEASFSPLNFVLPSKAKVYKIIIQENSFMERLSLNKQVAALGHEMAHFIQYEESGYLPTLFGLLRYVSSDTYRIKFEKSADKIAIEHGLGPQLLDFSFYTQENEIKEYMKKLDGGN